MMNLQMLKTERVINGTAGRGGGITKVVIGIN